MTPTAISWKLFLPFERNYTQYCNAEVDKLLAAQSRELDREKRKKIVWDIERMLVATRRAR